MSPVTWLARVRSAARLTAGLFGRDSQDAELAEELEFHIAQAAERNTRRGMAPDEARRVALAAFGGRAQWSEATRDEQRSRLTADFGRDLAYGADALRRNPAFALSAVTTIAIALAATTTVFSFINAVYLRPLAVPEGGRLVRVYGGDRPELDRQLGFLAFRSLQERTHAFDRVAAHYSTAPLYLTIRGESAETMGAVVSAEYFPMLGVRPALGRFFMPDEDVVPDRDAVAVIGYGLWRSRFGGDPNVLGQQIVINTRPFTVIGVAPRGFEGIMPGWVNELWIPTMMLHTGYRWCDGFTRSCPITSILARLAPGVSLGTARGELAALAPGLRELTNPADSIRTIAVERATGVTTVLQREYAHLSALLGTIAVVLMAVGCANLAGLLIARGIARRREIALRSSLGASRWRIARQLLTESLLVGIIGSAAGVVVSVWTSRALVGFFASDDEGYVHPLAVPIDWRVLAFAMAAALLAVMAFGLFPALNGSHVDPAESLKAGGGGPTRNRVRVALVAGQTTLAMALLVAAGLLTRSAGRVRSSGGLDAAHLTQLRLRPRLVGYTPERAQPYLEHALRAIRAVPGVVDAVPVHGSLASQSTGNVTVTLPGEGPTAVPNAPRVDYFDIGPGYFGAVGVPILVGREFTSHDTPDAPPVALVNEALAVRLWATLNVVGRTVVLDGKAFQVVGVVKDYRLHRVDEAPPATAYVAFWQNSFEPQIDARVAIRVEGDPARLFPALRRALATVDAAVPVTETITLATQQRANYTEVRLGSAVLAVSSALALFLSAVGLYGVVSFVVARRAREVGIRLAVGAKPSEVVSLFVRQGLRPMWVGATVGLALSVSFAPLLSRWLFGITPLDLPTIGSAAVAVLVVAAVATYVPARRAARTDPAVVFRMD